VTPLLTVPLSGQVSIVEPLTPGGLPNLGVDLKGPLPLQLRGNFVLVPGPGNVFDGLPDTPITRFELNFDADKLIATMRDLCQPPPPVFHADFEGHNGRKRSSDVAADVEGCGANAAKPTAKVKLRRSQSDHPRMKAKVKAGISGLKKMKLKLPKQLRFGGGRLQARRDGVGRRPRRRQSQAEAERGRGSDEVQGPSRKARTRPRQADQERQAPEVPDHRHRPGRGQDEDQGEGEGPVGSPGLPHLDHIRSYYEALNTGDPDRVAEHFTDDAVHYYTRLGPHEGARAIGENTKWAVDNLDGQWHLEHGIEQGDEAVIEWAMTWRDPKSGERRINRGTEWFRMRDGKIAEIRAYHHGDAKNPRGDLLGFDVEGRGYTTL
jgi:ketosteroid isomerase-like protein